VQLTYMTVCPLAYVKRPHCQTLSNFLYMLTVAVVWSSDDIGIRYILWVLWMTSCLPIIGHAKARPIRHILRVTHKGAAREAKC